MQQITSEWQQESPIETPEQLMLEYASQNLVLKDIEQIGNEFHGKANGLDFILMTLTKKLNAGELKKILEENEAKNIATALLLPRSTAEYPGKFLRQAVAMVERVNGSGIREKKNFYWNNTKQITEFELEIANLYGNRTAYFNPSDEIIEIVSFMRLNSRTVPNKYNIHCSIICRKGKKFNQSEEELSKYLSEEELMQVIKEREAGTVSPITRICKTYHKCTDYAIERRLNGGIRKISTYDKIKGPFTLETCERKTQPLIARIVGYKNAA